MCMMGVVGTTWTIAISPEIANWYRTLRPADRQLVDKMINKLQTLGNRLNMPHSRPLGDGLFELRFSLEHATVAQRITYTFAPEHRIITLTTFRKTRNNERTEIHRARQIKMTRNGHAIMNDDTAYIDYETLKAEVDNTYTSEQRREYTDAEIDADTQITLAELVYQMRTGAGMSQAELARRMGARQPFISDLERGGRTPTVATLNRVARATGNRLRLIPEQESAQYI